MLRGSEVTIIYIGLLVEFLAILIAEQFMELKLARGACFCKWIEQ